MGLLDGRVCVITGGAGSLGLASARRFLDEGAKVMLVDLEGATRARALADLASPNVAAVAADVSQATGARGYIERTVARFGPIDVLFGNAGNQGPVVPVTEYPEDAFDALLRRARARGLPRLQVRAPAHERWRQRHHHLQRG